MLDRILEVLFPWEPESPTVSILTGALLGFLAVVSILYGFWILSPQFRADFTRQAYRIGIDLY